MAPIAESSTLSDDVFDENTCRDVADSHTMPVAAPISPCTSEESSSASSSSNATVGDADPAFSITGKFSRIEYKYNIDSRDLGKGCHGSARECINRKTGQRYAVKT
eukprot:747781_1